MSQEVIVSEEDCGAITGIWVSESIDKGLLIPLTERVIGRMAGSPLANPATGGIINDSNEEINEDKAKE